MDFGKAFKIVFDDKFAEEIIDTRAVGIDPDRRMDHGDRLGIQGCQATAQQRGSSIPVVIFPKTSCSS